MTNRVKVALLFLMLTVLHVQAQDYSPMISGNTSLFLFEGQNESENWIEALQEEPGFISDYRGDAIKLLETLSDPTMGCNPHNMATWAGPKYVKGLPPNSPANTYYFFNKDNEPIAFQPLHEEGGKWTMYTYANGNYIEATISNKENLSFLELSDSVKTISIQLKNSSGTDLSNPLNNIIYKVSKNYGLIQLTSFLNFPTATAAGNLIGLTTPKKGLQLITSREIFNFDIGDEFHYDSLYQSVSDRVAYQGQTINRVTGIYRSANTDTVIYTFDQQKETRQINRQTSEVTYVNSRENVQEKYVFSNKQLYPSQANLNTEPFIRSTSYWLNIFSDDVRLKWNTYGGMLYKQSDNDPTCWELHSYGSLSFRSYLEGCGLFLDSMHYWNSGADYGYKRLVYFKKGEQQWGDALILSSTTKKENTNLTLFPNPLKQGELLHFNTTNFNVKQVFIYHTTGNKVLESTEDASPIKSLDLSGLQAGLYLVQLVNEKNERISQQLLIK